MTTFKERRFGRFHLRGNDLLRFPLEFLTFFQENKILVLETTYNWCRQGHEYLAWSPNFEPVPLDSDAFNYTVDLNLQIKELSNGDQTQICTGILIFKSDKVGSALFEANKIEEEAIKEFRLKTRKLQKQFLNKTTKGKKYVQQN